MAYEATVQGVTFKDVNRKSDGQPIRIFEIEDSNRIKWTTSRKDLASEANRLIGHPAIIQGRQEQNGLYTNYYLEDLHAANGGAPAFDPGSQFAQPQGYTPPPGSYTGAATSPPIPPPTPPPPIPAATSAAPVATQGPSDLDWSIWRQCATKVGALISGTPVEFWRNVEDLIAFYHTGIKPTPPVTSNAAPNQFVPTEAIQQANTEFQGADHDPDSDIPFVWIDTYGREPGHALRWK